MKRVALEVLLALSLSPLALAQNPCEPQRVVSPPEINTPDFGWKVRTNGEQWFVSSTDANTLCPGPVLSCSTGAVFVYDQVDGQLVHTQTVVPPDAELYDNFGISMDVEGNRLVVGSLYTRSSRVGDRPGTVFTYEHDGERWVEVDRIEPPLTAREEFGNAVELVGDTLIVTPQSSHSFFVYEPSDDGWELKQEVEAPEPLGPSGAGFGGPWASNDDWFVTSAYLDRRIVGGGGSLFIYRREPDGQLTLVQQVRATSVMYLGGSLAFDGDTLLVGAPTAERDFEIQGIVQMYELDGVEWVLSGELVTSQAKYNARFGQPIALHGDVLLVTAYFEGTARTRGVVYRFEREPGGPWIEVGTLEPNPPSDIGAFGHSIATDGRYALAGAYEEDAAYFFDLTCGDCEPDLDADGSLTIFDFLAFFNAFDAGDPIADFDSDGELTIFDFLAFQNAFDAGCG